MPTKHYRIGGSTIDRTIACPAWIKRAEKLPPKGTSEYAEKGTLLHDCMEEILLEGITPQDCLGKTRTVGKDVYMVDADDIPRLESAFEEYEEVCKRYNIDHVEVEREVCLENKDIGGTGDVWLFGPDDIICLDWKFGQGIQVDPSQSGQGLFYLTCLIHGISSDEGPSLDDIYFDLYGENLAFAFAQRNYHFIVVQPNDRDEPVARTASYTRDHINDMFHKIDSAELKSHAKNAIDNMNTGSHCRFCPVAPVCPAKTGEAEAALRIDPKSKDFTQLERGLHMVEDLEKWCAELRKTAHEQLEQGNKIPNWKLVQKRATRKWVDEEETLAVLNKSRTFKRDEYTTSKLVSPAQFEKICKKKGVDFDKYSGTIHSVSSGTTLAHADDPRKEVVPHKAIKNLRKRFS